MKLIHAYSLDGKRLCGAMSGPISQTGAVVTCQECKYRQKALSREYWLDYWRTKQAERDGIR